MPSDVEKSVHVGGQLDAVLVKNGYAVSAEGTHEKAKLEHDVLPSPVR
jgi:hypothetical protein